MLPEALKSDGRCSRPRLPRTPRSSTLLTVALLLLAGCSSLKVTTDHDPGADFTRYRTYSWFAEDSEEEVKSLLDSRIERALTAELTGKGLRQVETEGDLLVSYQTSVADRVAVHSDYDRRWGGGQVYTTNYKEGTLTVDLLDPARKQVVWTASATDVVTDGVDETRLAEAVRALLQRYPPMK